MKYFDKIFYKTGFILGLFIFVFDMLLDIFVLKNNVNANLATMFFGVLIGGSLIILYSVFRQIDRLDDNMSFAVNHPWWFTGECILFFLSAFPIILISKRQVNSGNFIELFKSSYKEFIVLGVEMTLLHVFMQLTGFYEYMYFHRISKISD